METVSLAHTFQVSATPEAVYAHLCNPANYVGLNPNVVAVRDIQEHEDTTEFVAIERLRWLGIVVTTTPIFITIRPEKPQKTVTYEIRGRGGVQARIATEITADGDAAEVRETFTVQMPALLRRAVTRSTRAAMPKRAEELTARFGR